MTRHCKYCSNQLKAWASPHAKSCGSMECKTKRKKEACKNWHSKNKEKQAVYRASNPRPGHKIKEANRKRYLKFRGTFLEQTRLRRKRMRSRSFLHERDRINIIYHCAQLITVKSGEKYCVDHVIPLNHPLVCGLHVAANLRILKSSENDSKGNTWDGTYENASKVKERA